MKKTIGLVLSLAVASGNASAQWFAIRGDAKATLYVNPKAVRKDGDIAKMVHIVEFNTSQDLEHFRSYISIRAESETDCAKNRLRLLRKTYHSQTMAGGSIVETDSAPTAWIPISPGSESEVLQKVACGNL